MNSNPWKRFGRPLVTLGAAVAMLAACSRQGERATADPTPVKSAIVEKATVSGAKCAAHGAPKELCFICDATLRDKGRAWCEEHGRYEDRDWECHPELRDKNRLYCTEHSLYEDECFLCHPELKKGTARAGEVSQASTAPMCKEHGVPEDEDGICHPELLSQKQPGQGLKVRLASTKSATEAGVVVSSPGMDRMEQSVECFAELTFDQNKLAQINPLVGGVIKSVEVDLGSRVKKGALLARITSAAIGEAQSDYLKASAEDDLSQKAVERQRKLRDERISSEKDLQESEAAHRATTAALQQARQHLMVLGFDQQRIRSLAEQNSEPGVLDIRAPFAGEIIERTAVQGAMVEMGKPLFTLADTTVLWAMVNIPEVQIGPVHVGQKVELTFESLPDKVFTGTLTWLASGVDEHTRLARGRAEVANAEGLLKAQMFARARILTTRSTRAVLVPESALQNVSGTVVVFVKSGEDLYEARSVRLGARRDGQVQVLAGLSPADEVVVSGAFALKSQFLISRLGAGCVD
jgi:cobalt-zinc-cadmium efflux system membrane fusion protein